MDHCAVCRGPSGKWLHKEGGFCNFSQQSPWDHPHWILWVAKSWGVDSGRPPSALLLLGLGCDPSCPAVCPEVCAMWMLGSQPLYLGLVPSWCVTSLPEVGSWNHKMVSVGRGQFGFNLRPGVWNWAGPEQARALGWGVDKAAVSHLFYWFLSHSTGAVGAKLFSACPHHHTHYCKPLFLLHTIVSWHYDFTASFPPPICSCAAALTTCFISGFYQSQRCKPIVLLAASALKADDLIHAFPKVAMWGFPLLVLIPQFEGRISGTREDIPRWSHNILEENHLVSFLHFSTGSRLKTPSWIPGIIC